MNDLSIQYTKLRQLIGWLKEPDGEHGSEHVASHVLQLIDTWYDELRWREWTERPAAQGHYQVIQRQADGGVRMYQGYWTGAGWDTRAQVLFWRPRDFPPGVPHGT